MGTTFYCIGLRARPHAVHDFNGGPVMGKIGRVLSVGCGHQYFEPIVRHSTAPPSSIETVMKTTGLRTRSILRSPQHGTSHRVQPRSKTRKHSPSHPNVPVVPPPTRQPIALLPEQGRDPALELAVFDYFNETASTVYLSGSFNHWNPQEIPMTRRRGDLWTAELWLHPGDYEYRFLVDGLWMDDPMAPRFVSNPYGGFNALRRIHAQPASEPARKLGGDLRQGVLTVAQAARPEHPQSGL